MRSDPAFKLACGRLPDSGADLCSQPTMSRLENMPAKSDIRAALGALVDIYCASYRKPPKTVTLDIDDIDDTVDVVYGKQQLSFFDAREDEYCFKPIHVYDAATGRPVLVLPRPGKTPSGREVRRHWPKTVICICGDCHYGRPEVMQWCEENRVKYVFGLQGNDIVAARFTHSGKAASAAYARKRADRVRRYAEARYGARSWAKERRVLARIEVSRLGASTSATWSPTSRAAHRRTSTPISIARAAKRKT